MDALQVNLTHGHAVALHGDLRHPLDLLGDVAEVRRIARDIDLVGVDVLGLLEPVGLDQLRIVGRVVGHHDDRRAVVAVDEGADLLVDVHVHRAAHDLAAARSQPVARRVEQGVGHLLIADDLKLPEKADRLVPDLRMGLVGDGGDGADRLAVAQGAEELDLGVLVKGFTAGSKCFMRSPIRGGTQLGSSR